MNIKQRKSILFILVFILTIFSPVYASEVIEITDFTVNEGKYVGKEYIMGTSGTSTNGILYKYIIRDDSTGKWHTVQDYSRQSSYTWIPEKVGNYRLVVHVKDENSNALYDDYDYKDIEVQNKVEVKEKDIEVQVKNIETQEMIEMNVKAKISNFTVNEGGYVGKEYILGASGANADKVLYKYIIRDDSTGKWHTVQDYSRESNYTWLPKKAGSYRLVVHVRDEHSNSAYDDYAYEDIKVKNSITKINNFTVNEGEYVGKEYILGANGANADKVLYKYWVRDNSTGKWSILQNYSAVSSYTWVPEKVGNYRLVVHVKDENSNALYDAYAYKDIEVKKIEKAKEKEAKINNFTVNEGEYVGKEYIMGTSGTSTNGILYKYIIRDDSTGKWHTVQDYSRQSSYTWIPEKVGNYRLVVHVKDENSNALYDDYDYKDIEVQSAITNINNFTVNEGEYVGKGYTLGINGTSTNRILYKYWVRDNSTGKWSILQNYSAVSSYTWVPEKVGKYRLTVHVKDEYSNEPYDDFDYKDIEVKKEEATISKFTVNEGKYVGDKYLINSDGISATGILYKYFIRDNSTGKWHTIQDYSRKSSYTWVPEKAGNYRLVVHVRDERSNSEYDDYMYKDIEVKGSIIYQNSYYNHTLKEVIDIQMNRSPQTDKYRNLPAYIRTSHADKTAVVLQNVNIRTSANTNSSNNIYPRTTSFIEVEILDRNITGSSYGGSTVWYRIKYDNNSNLYVHSKLVDETYYKANRNLLIKSEEADGSHTYGTIKSGNIFKIKNTTSNGWYEMSDYIEWKNQENKDGKLVLVEDRNHRMWRNPTREDLEQYVNPKNWIDTNRENINTNMYQFLVLSGRAGATETQLNAELASKGVLAGMGNAFIEASKKSNTNEVYLMAHALLETGHGSSTLANGVEVGKNSDENLVLVNSSNRNHLTGIKTTYNMYGIGAVDNNPLGGGATLAYTEGWFTVEDAIIGGASWINRRYINNTHKQDTLYKMRWNPASPGYPQYATDIGWAVKQTKSMGITVDFCLQNGIPMVFDIPKYK